MVRCVGESSRDGGRRFPCWMPINKMLISRSATTDAAWTVLGMDRVFLLIALIFQDWIERSLLWRPSSQMILKLLVITGSIHSNHDRIRTNERHHWNRSVRALEKRHGDIQSNWSARSKVHTSLELKRTWRSAHVELWSCMFNRAQHQKSNPLIHCFVPCW